MNPEQLLKIIGAVIGTILGIGTIFSTISYWRSQIKNGGGQAEDKLVSTLKELIAAQDQKITELQASHAENQKRISVLEGRVTEMSKINGDLRDIIVIALNHWLENNPEEAAKIAKEVQSAG